MVSENAPSTRGSASRSADCSASTPPASWGNDLEINSAKVSESVSSRPGNTPNCSESSVVLVRFPL